VDYPGFIGGSYQAQSLTADAERTVNLYVEKFDVPSAKHDKALYPTPGFAAFSQPLPGFPTGIPDVGARAFKYANGRLFAVMATGLYEINSDGTWTKRGTIMQDSMPAQIAFNGLAGGQLLIGSGSNAYCFVLATNTLTQVLTGEAHQVDFAHGYFLAFNRTNGHVRLSALNDGTSWDPNQFFARSLLADPWQTMFVDSQSLVWLIGTETYEVWYDSGAFPQPFAPLTGLIGRYGIVAPAAFAVLGNQSFWLTTNSEGDVGLYTPAGGGGMVSTYAVASALADYEATAKITDAECLTHAERGHPFIIVQCPSVPATWAYDVKSQSWAERGRWNSAQNRFDLWAPRVHVKAFGKHLVGDRTTGTIAEMSARYGTEIDGTPILRLRQAPGLTDEHKRHPIDQLELLMDTGLSLVSGGEQDTNVQAMLRVSDDAGRTFGNERRAGIGRIGEYRRRVFWTRLGAPPDAVVRVTFATQAPTRIVNAWLNNLEQVA